MPGPFGRHATPFTSDHMYKYILVYQIYKQVLVFQTGACDPCPMAAEEIFKALAAPQRQQILRLVRDEPRSAGEIADACEASQQAVSHHLQVLKDAGLVAVQRDGQRRLYLVDPDAFGSFGAFVSELWPGALEKLKAEVESDTP